MLFLIKKYLKETKRNVVKLRGFSTLNLHKEELPKIRKLSLHRVPNAKFRPILA
jgi:hypothetical protein